MQITVEALKQRLGIDPANSSRDVSLAAVLAAVEISAEAYIGRKLLKQEYIEQYNGNGKNSLVLNQYPVVEIAEVQINGKTVQDWRHDNWLLMREAGFSKGLRNVQVRYSAGYDTLPADFCDAVLQIAAQRIFEINNKGVQSKSLAGETITYSSFSQSDGMPPAALSILKRYKRVC